MKNRMRESRSFGSVRGEGSNVLAYSEILSCTSMHFQALSCNGRLPKGCKILIMPGSRVRVPPFPPIKSAWYRPAPKWCVRR